MPAREDRLGHRACRALGRRFGPDALGEGRGAEPARGRRVERGADHGPVARRLEEHRAVPVQRVPRARCPVHVERPDLVLGLPAVSRALDLGVDPEGTSDPRHVGRLQGPGTRAVQRVDSLERVALLLRAAVAPGEHQCQRREDPDGGPDPTVLRANRFPHRLYLLERSYASSGCGGRGGAARYRPGGGSAGVGIPRRRRHRGRPRGRRRQRAAGADRWPRSRDGVGVPDVS